MALKYVGIKRASVLCFGVLTAIALAGSALSCQSPSHSEVVGDIETRTPRVAHVRHSQRLRTVMHEINDLSLRRLPQEMGSSLGQRKRIQSIALVAEKISETATQLPSLVDELSLDQTQRASFIDLAELLRKDALELSKIARASGHPTKIQSKLDEMVTTCNACHHLFRDPIPEDLSVPLEF